MLFVKLKTFHNNNERRMPVSAVKWVNLTAICVFLTVVLSSPANGFTPIGGFQNGAEGRKLFGGYRITPKHCRGTKTLPLSDPRSKGPTICMFNHECAQRNGEVVGACMDGFLFGACCQVPQSSANENTLIQDAQNPLFQSNTHSTESYDPALYGSSQKFESNEFQEIQTTSTKYQDPSTTQSSYIEELGNHKVHKVNKTSTNNKIFYVNKGSVMVSSPSSLSHNDDYVMLSSSSSQSPFGGGNHNKVSFTTELPMKISTDLVDNEDSTQLPILLTETVQVKKNYSSGSLDLDIGEFTHSDITHPGAESVLIDNDLQFSTGYGGPQSVYVPPPAHAEIIPPKRRPVQRPTIIGPSKKPSNDKYVLIQTLEASKRPTQTTGTTSTGISTNIDSIESIILMLNGTNHGPSYEVANTSPTYNQKQPYGQNQGYGTTHRPAVQTYVPVTTSRPIVTVTTGSGVVLSDHVIATTPEPAYYDDADTKRPTTTYVEESTEQTSNKYHSIEVSDEKPTFVEIPSPPHKITDKIDSAPPVGPSQDSYNIVSGQVNYAGNNVNVHKDASNPDYGYTSPAQPTSDFNKMPAVGEAYPVMDEETSAYLESSMLFEEQALSQNSQQSEQVADKNIPTYGQNSEQEKPSQQAKPIHQKRPPVQIITQQNKVQTQSGYPSQNRPSQQGVNFQSEGGYYDESIQNDNARPQSQEGEKKPQQSYDQSSQSHLTQSNRPIPQENKVQASHHRPSSKIPNQNYEQLVHNKPLAPSSQAQAQDYQQISQNRPSQQASSAGSQDQAQDYQQINQNRPSAQDYQQISQNRPSQQASSKPSSQDQAQDYQYNRPSPQPSNQDHQQTSSKPSSHDQAQDYQQINHQPSNQNYDQVAQSRPSQQTSPRPSSQDQTPDYSPIAQNRPSTQASPQDYQQGTHTRPSSQGPTQDYSPLAHNRPSSQEPAQDYQQRPSQSGPSHPTLTQVYEKIVQNRPSTQRPAQDYQQISQSGYITRPTASHVHVRPTSQILTTSYEVQSSNRPTSGYLPHSSTTHIVRPTIQLVTQSYEVEDENSYDSNTSSPTQQVSDETQDGYDQVNPTSQLVTQGYDTSQQSDYVSQSSESDKDTYQTPESQLIAQLTEHIKNGYLSNQRPTAQVVSQDQYNHDYLSRPTPQSTKVQAGYYDQSSPSPIAQVIDQNNQLLAQAGYFSQPPNFEKIQPPTRPTALPNRISTLIVQQHSSARPTSVRPTKPTKVNTVTYSEVETNYPNPTQSAEVSSTSSSTSRPTIISSTKRPSKRPTKRVTKRPTTQKKPSTNKVQTTAQQSSQIYNKPPAPQKFSGVPPSTPTNKRVTTKHPLKKQPPSTSYVTGPTTPRPDELLIVHNPTPIADKVDTFVSSTQSPIYNSIYVASPTDEIILQSIPTSSSHHNYNKPLFVKIPSATQKPPSPTVIITPKPTVVNLITANSSSKRPTTTPIPTYAGSNSYIYSPLVTRRPEYASSTQEYVNIAQVTSNDFEDPGYSGLHTLTTQVLNKIPTDDRPAFPGYYGPTPSYPTFELPSDKYGDVVEEEEETYTSPNDFVNFPPVRNPNLNMSATSSSVTSDLELSTPAFVEDTILKDKMNTLVHKIVESLQDNFEALADMIDDNNNTAAGFSETTPVPTTLVTRRPSTKAPTRKPATKPSSSSRPTRVSTKKPPTRVSTPATTKRPAVTTRRPAVTTRKPTTKKPATRKPTRKATTTTTAIPTQEDELVEEEEDVNNEVDSNIGEESNESERKFQCGVRPHVKSGRIVGGKGSTFGEFPWQVLVRESTWLGLFTKNKCGGVLITNKYVVTAAHCQPGFLASLVAVMGEYDISGDLESKRSVTKNVKRVIVHRQYDPATFENDLALLELESPVLYDTHIVPICMPADTADFTGRMATVTGWGRLKYGGGVPSVLQEVQVPIIENSVCQEMFHTAGHNKKILQSFLCAGYANGQKDSCEGDSGGPLVLQRSDGRYELAGTVSHGIKCAAPYLPGVYMRTTFYKPWLRSITGVK